MKLGVFNVPYANKYAEGKRTAQDVIAWDLQLAQWADEYGLDEAFFAEHYTIGAEPSPAPDLMIAAASQLTKRITLGAAAHLLPYHNPVALAHRMMWLDHMTGGRYIGGVAPGAFPSDAKLFGTGKNNPAMMMEALEIIEAIHSQKGPFEIAGKYFSVDMPAYSDDIHGPHLTPFRDRLPLMMTGMSENSSTIKLAASRGIHLLSQQVHEKAWRNHWEVYSRAAAETGHETDRSNWRVCRDIIVADTDEEAVDLVRNGAMGELWSKHNIPFFKSLGLGNLLTGGLVDQDDLTLDWMIDNFFIIGSVQTVIDKANALYESVNGFGTLITFAHEYTENPEPYRYSFELLGRKVKPALLSEAEAAAA